MEGVDKKKLDDAFKFTFGVGFSFLIIGIILYLFNDVHSVEKVGDVLMTIGSVLVATGFAIKIALRAK
ncbi:MAG: hypothetical protein KGI07_05645 [Thaumarchaeota archaeon]|nr:hypothetical protein [Nitrososphaerota archaeon]